MLIITDHEFKSMCAKEKGPGSKYTMECYATDLTLSLGFCFHFPFIVIFLIFLSTASAGDCNKG